MKKSIACALLLAAVGLTAGSSFGQATPAAAAPPAPTKTATGMPPVDAAAEELPIEICFVIDTTGSMGRLLQGAKDKVWSIANSILKDNPNAALKMGIVAYRDRDRGTSHEEYITKDIDLTDDLDSLYKELIALRAAGGGDKPESVNQALQDAVERISWSKTPAIRLIFLVGDAPPHMDYPDDVKYPDTIAKANKLNIFVNTIQCGNDAETETIWNEIAEKGHGAYFALPQSGNVIAISTPQDKKLLDLNADLAATVVPYGTKDQQIAVKDKAESYKAMPLEAAAERLSVNSLTGGRALQGKGDLVQDMQTDKGLVARLKAEELPANMQTMTADERQAYLDGLLAKRKTINDQIASVTKERDAAVKLENERLAAATPPGGFGAGGGGGGRAGRGAGGAGGGGGGGRGGGGSFDGAVRAGAAAGRAAGGR